MSLFEQILQTNLINFIIVLSSLVLIYKKAKLGSLIEKMAQDIKNKVEKSSLDTKSALEEYKQTKKSMVRLAQEQEEILQNAKENAQKQKENIEEASKIQLSEIQNSLEKITASQKDAFKTKAVQEIYDICVNLAKSQTLKMLDNETQKRLVDISIDELDKIEGTLL